MNRLLALLLLTCKNNRANDPTPAQLPPATQHGANTFACQENGKVFRQKDQIRGLKHTLTLIWSIF